MDKENERFTLLHVEAVKSKKRNADLTIQEENQNCFAMT